MKKKKEARKRRCQASPPLASFTASPTWKQWKQLGTGNKHPLRITNRVPGKSYIRFFSSARPHRPDFCDHLLITFGLFRTADQPEPSKQRRLPWLQVSNALPRTFGTPCFWCPLFIMSPVNKQNSSPPQPFQAQVSSQTHPGPTSSSSSAPPHPHRSRVRP